MSNIDPIHLINPSGRVPKAAETKFTNPQHQQAATAWETFLEHPTEANFNDFKTIVGKMGLTPSQENAYELRLRLTDVFALLTDYPFCMASEDPIRRQAWEDRRRSLVNRLPHLLAKCGA